jgi:hypothetical protein
MCIDGLALTDIPQIFRRVIAGKKLLIALMTGMDF